MVNNFDSVIFSQSKGNPHLRHVELIRNLAGLPVLVVASRKEIPRILINAKYS